MDFLNDKVSSYMEFTAEGDVYKRQGVPQPVREEGTAGLVGDEAAGGGLCEGEVKLVSNFKTD